MLLNFLQDYGGPAGGGDFGPDPRSLLGGAFGGLGVAADDEAERQRRLGRFLQNVTPAEAEAMRRADARTPAAPPLSLDQLVAQEADRSRRTFGDPANVPLASQATPSLVPQVFDQQPATPRGGGTNSPPPLTRDDLGLSMGRFDDLGRPRASDPVPPSVQLTREAFGLVPEVAPSPRSVEAGEGRGGGSAFAGQSRGGDGAGAATPKLPEAVAQQPDPLAILAQRGTFDAADRYTPSPFEQRMAQLTGVAYGQMPLQFDPRLRMQVAQQMAGEGLANAELASKRDLLQMQLAAQERVANAENANRLAVAEMQHRPHPRTISNDLLLKMVANSQATDPTGATLQQTVDAYKLVAPQIEAMMLANQRADPNAPATERPGFGAPQPVAPTLTPPVAPGRVAALLQSMRNVASTTKQNEAGQTVYELNPAVMQGEGPARLAQIYSQAGDLTPAERADFLRQMGAGPRGGLGDINQLREAAAIELAKTYLQAKNFGRDLAVNGAYPDTVAIPDPADPARTLVTLGVTPRGTMGRLFADAREQLLNNLSENDMTAPIPWEQLTVPGRGTVPFPRGEVRPIFGQDAARQKAGRDLDTLLRFYADIAQQQIPQPAR